MSEGNRSDNVLLNNRRAFSARQSMDALISFARDQDEKIYNRGKKMIFGKGLAALLICGVPFVWVAYNMTIGPWRSIYHTSVLTTSVEAIQGNHREYFVPEMYLKEREIRKIELGLKDTEQLKTLFAKKE